MADINVLATKDYPLRMIERVMDYDWLFARLSPYYCHDNGQNRPDQVVLVKIVLIQHLFGIPSLRQTYQRISDTLCIAGF
jgi:transposase